MKELNDATAAPGPGPAASSSSRPSDQAAANFQDRIKQTMDRMKSSGAEVDAAVADSETDDFLSEMLKQMQGAAGEGESDEDFSKMLLNMMEQLTSKEILYEPMKELNEKYPEWLRNNESKQSAEDLQRYREQYGVVKEIVAKFEEPEYRDESDKDREFIIDRMQKVVGLPLLCSPLSFQANSETAIDASRRRTPKRVNGREGTRPRYTSRRRFELCGTVIGRYMEMFAISCILKRTL